MSYILDALRRADAERQRGAVPGLHDQANPLAADAALAGGGPVAHRLGRLARWAAGAGLLLGALAAAWWLGRGTGGGGVGGDAVPAMPMAPPLVQPTPNDQPGLPGRQGPAPPARPFPAPGPDSNAALPPPPAPVPMTGGAPAPVPVIGRPPAPPAPRQATEVSSPGGPAAGQAPPPTPPLPVAKALPPAPADNAAPAAATPPAAAGATPPGGAASDPVRPWASLAPAARAALPALAWSGVVFAERADQRLVIVNGQVAREGDTLAPGLQLLQIGPKSVVLRWQGQRIEVPL